MTMNKLLDDAKASGLFIRMGKVYAQGGYYDRNAKLDITKELVKFAELVASTVPDADLLKELEALNRYMREKGLGQGEIDSISSLYDEIDELKLQAASTVPDGLQLGDIVTPSKSVCDRWAEWKPTDLLKIVAMEYKRSAIRVISDEINYTIIELDNPESSLTDGWVASDFQAAPEPPKGLPK